MPFPGRKKPWQPITGDACSVKALIDGAPAGGGAPWGISWRSPRRPRLLSSFRSAMQCTSTRDALLKAATTAARSFRSRSSRCWAACSVTTVMRRLRRLSDSSITRECQGSMPRWLCMTTTSGSSADITRANGAMLVASPRCQTGAHAVRPGWSRPLCADRRGRPSTVQPRRDWRAKVPPEATNIPRFRNGQPTSRSRQF